MSESANVVIPNPPIKRLGAKAGITRFSNNMCEDVRMALRVWMESVANNAKIHCEHGGRITINSQDVRRALPPGEVMFSAKPPVKRCGIKHKQQSESDKKPHRFRNGTVARQAVRYYQKQSTCLQIPRQRFKNYFKDFLPEDFTVGGDACLIAHHAAEAHLVDLLHRANLQAQHAGRKTVRATDVEMAAVARGTPYK
jgi:histone H3